MVGDLEEEIMILMTLMNIDLIRNEIKVNKCCKGEKFMKFLFMVLLRFPDLQVISVVDLLCFA